MIKKSNAIPESATLELPLAYLHNLLDNLEDEKVAALFRGFVAFAAIREGYVDEDVILDATKAIDIFPFDMIDSILD